MEINITKPVKVNAKTLKLNIKVSDQFSGELFDQDSQIIKEYDGYVPDFFPGSHFGDYLFLDIDIDTGVITNWEKPKAEDIEKFIKGEDE